MFTVYILYSESRKRYYVGQTADFGERLQRHNAGMVLSTKSGRPWVCVWKAEVETRAASMQLEKKIKKRGAGRFLADENDGV